MTDIGSTGSLPSTIDGWRRFFADFENVVLVANSDAVDVDALQASFAEGTLFVFFNKTYKVLREPFGRPSLLVARSSEAGANIVYRREVAAVVRPFDPASFHGILNLRAAATEWFRTVSDFENQTVGFLDLSDRLRDIYPDDRLPSSGFALAVWLAEQRLPSTAVRLAGFSAKRSERWKLFQAHDWTFEQTAQRMLVRAGQLAIVGETHHEAALIRLAERFPEIPADRIALTANEVLGERLANTDAAVDRLLSLTRLQGAIDRVVRSLKPKTRKERLRAASNGENTASGLAKKRGPD